MSLFDEIPGYREAVAKESELRDHAFLPLPEFICGVEVFPITYSHLLMLLAADSPFVVGGPISPERIVQFLWCISPEYKAAMRVFDALSPWMPRLARRLLELKRKRFVKRIRSLPYSDAVQGCAGFLEEALQDGPGSPTDGETTAPYFSSAAAIVTRVCLHFHWSESHVLNMPLKRLWQYVRALTKATDSAAILFNPSDKVRGEWLAQRQPARSN